MKTRLFVSFVLIATLLLSVCACVADDVTKSDAIIAYPATLSPQERRAFPDAFRDGNNQLGLYLAANNYDEKNMSLSPASLELALLMAYMGADGQTAEQMKEALFMSGLSDDELLSAVRQMMWRANTHGMEAANSLWAQKDFPFFESFLDTCADAFMSDLFSADFWGDATGVTDAINRWVSEKTHGKIDPLHEDPLSTDTVMVLINALYFLGDWETPFEANDTFDQTFYGTTGQMDVPFMHDTRFLPYMQTDTYKMISLDFKSADDANENNPYAMAFILPDASTDVVTVLNALAATGFDQAVADLGVENTIVSLPKYEFEYSLSMTEPLQQLGIKDAFIPFVADFGRLAERDDIYISDVIHSCYIRVDEKGAEAAAVTEVDFQVTSIIIEDDLKTFVADRPFIFAIYDKTDATILFLGVVAQF